MAVEFNFDLIEDEEAHAPYPFTSEGVKWRVPHPRDLITGQLLALERGMAGDLQSAVVAVRDVAERWDAGAKEWVKDPPQAASLILGRRPAVVGKFLATWAAHAGMNPGESGASSR